MFNTKGNKKRVCYKCNSRYIGCHSECEKYLKEIEKNKHINEEILKNKHIYNENKDYLVKQIVKIKK